MQENQEALVEGRRAVQEALRAGQTIDKLYVQRDAKGLHDIVSQARENGAAIVEVPRATLDAMSRTQAHQGLVATLAAWTYATVDELLARARDKGEPPFIVVCDGIEDEGNLGSIIRTAEAAGAHGLIVPKRRSASLSPRTMKASAGAAAHLPVARVPGIPALLRDIKQQGLWVYGADMEGKPASSVDFTGGVALVMGAEGKGLSPLVRQACDFLVGIPMYGQVSSLNVSAAAAVLLFAVAQSRANNTN